MEEPQMNIEYLCEHSTVITGFLNNSWQILQYRLWDGGYTKDVSSSSSSSSNSIPQIVSQQTKSMPTNQAPKNEEKWFKPCSLSVLKAWIKKQETIIQ
jgi:hypothetical protein